MLSMPWLASFWSAPAVAANLVVFLNLFGALLLGLVVGYERAYHGRAAGMRGWPLPRLAQALTQRPEVQRLRLSHARN